jgi:hypothetical protein
MLGPKRAIFRNRVRKLEAGVKPHACMRSGYPVKRVAVRIVALAFFVLLR